MLLIDWNDYTINDKIEFNKDPVTFIRKIYQEYNPGDEIAFKNYISKKNITEIHRFQNGDVIINTNINNLISSTLPRNEYYSNKKI